MSKKIKMNDNKCRYENIENNSLIVNNNLRLKNRIITYFD